MGLRILTNTASIAAQHQLAISSASQSRELRRLATGLRVDTAADDVAGSAVATRLRARIRSMEQSRRNANDGISLVHTAEGALQEASDMVHRLRELAVQAKSSAIGAEQRQTIGTEFDTIVAEINRIGASTTFGGVKLFGNPQGSVNLQVGPDATGYDVIAVPLASLEVGFTFPPLDEPFPEPGAVPGDPGVPALTAQIDELLQSIVALRSRFGAIENRLTHVISLLGRTAEDGSAALSRVVDVDHAAATASLARDRIAVEAGNAVLRQANVQPGLALRLLQ